MDQGHLGVLFAESATRHADRTATRIKTADGWATRTYAELATAVRRLAGRLIDLGIQPGDRIAIFSPNRPEWTLADLACLSVRAVPVPLYPSSTPEQIRHILADSGCVAAFAAGSSELDRLLDAWDGLPDLRVAVTFDEVGGDQPRVVSLDELTSHDTDTARVDERLAGAHADELASLIYTSGTTGEPKGVMLTHRGFTFQIEALDEFFDITADDSSLCFLPLSHALERAWTFCVLAHGCLNTYVPDPKNVAKSLVEARPSMFVSVPRLYEKVFLTAYQKAAESPAKQRIFDWALGVGRRCQHAYRSGRTPSAALRAQLQVADRLVLRSVREALGGPKSVMACGGAPLRPEICEFFSAIGMLLCEGYGLTEASPLVTFNAPDAFKFGTVGRVIVGGELRIADEGELCYRGPNLMAGYWNQPDATAATIRDGWLHTGDVGYIDTDGFVVVTDRIKDLIVTSNGKNIAPAPIEGMLLADPLFEHAVLLGDNRPYLTLLVSPSPPDLEQLAGQLQVAWQHRDELFNHPAIVAEIKRRVASLTAKLPSHEQIKDLRVALEEFTLDNGLLTPTLKVKRKEVEKRFAQLIEEMYSSVRRVVGKEDAAS